MLSNRVMKKRFCLFFILLWLSAFSVSAATLKWLVKPEYDTICYYSDNIFKCIKDSKIQLIDFSGRSLLPSEADTITDFTDGLAPVLDKKGLDFKIKGFLTEKEHYFIQVNGNYYSTRYSHFSETLLAVADEKGRQGYLNTRGDIAIPCKFGKARPFIKGWAAVVSDKDGVGYINKQGEYMIVHFHYGALSEGTNFNEQGEALVGYSKNGQSDFAVINTNGKKVRKYEKRRGKPYRDYDYAFCEDGMEIAPKRNNSPSFDEKPIPFFTEGLWNYRIDDKDIVPAQFTYAGRFADGLAIIALDGKHGVVTLLEGDFSSSFDDNIVIRSYKKQELHYSLNIPETLDSEQVQVKFDVGDGSLNPIQLNQGVYTFIPYVAKKAKSCTMRAEVCMDGLLLWKEIITKEVNPVARISFDAPNKTSDRANEQDILTIVTMVTNNTETPLKVSTIFTNPSFHNGSKNKLVSKSDSDATLAPGEKKSFTMTFKVYELETVKIVVTVKSDHQSMGTKSSSIVLKPFDLVE